MARPRAAGADGPGKDERLRHHAARPERCAAACERVPAERQKTDPATTRKCWCRPAPTSPAPTTCRLVVGVSGGKPVTMADGHGGRRSPTSHPATCGMDSARRSRRGEAGGERFPAVTLSISKKPGENAADVADGLIRRIEALEGSIVPDGVEVTVTRNYGATATEKADKLIGKLVFCHLGGGAAGVLRAGRREAVIVGRR